ncbi:MAG: DNA repair protein RecO [Leptolyngbyaceae cyanobacterium SL_5_9]|nr:DNA repair protein RecO [Leptolyngbyaceae cyanobacterium SL_5_9]NJO74022.1 DNA repair protein RecO [Leptolyngbyaceae cyanobacterium RM1_406_9]
MGGTYKATGINLKSMPLGESDRLLTVLTREFGLIRVVAPGSRKHKSSLGGRSGLFVVNQLLIAKGRSLDKIIQAESLQSYAGLSQDLRKLTASQYLAELALFQALSEQPQEDLFCLLVEHLDRLEKLPRGVTLASLAHATFHLLALAGVAPQVQLCSVSQQLLVPDFDDPNWRVGFSAVAGGIVSLAALDQLTAPKRSAERSEIEGSNICSGQAAGVQPGGIWAMGDRPNPAHESPSSYPTRTPKKNVELHLQINATELALLQQLSQPDFIQPDGTLAQPQDRPIEQPLPEQIWLSIERILRHYAQYHLDQPIRSAALIDTCFSPLPQPIPSP